MAFETCKIGYGKHIFDVCGGKVLAQWATTDVSFASLGIALRGKWTDVGGNDGGVYITYPVDGIC